MAESVISAIAVILVCVLNNLFTVQKVKTVSKKTAIEENKATKLGIQALLRDRLYQMYLHYSEKGYAPIYARENFTNMYKQYHSLGANGVMDDIKEKFEALPPVEKAGDKNEQN